MRYFFSSAEEPVIFPVMSLFKLVISRDAEEGVGKCRQYMMVDIDKIKKHT